MCMFNMNNLVLETQPNECKAKGDAINHKSETLGHAMLVRAHVHTITAHRRPHKPIERALQPTLERGGLV